MIKIEGFKDELQKLGLIDKIYTQELLKEANNIGLDFRDDVRANTPVGRTGDLRRSTNFDGAELKNKDIEIKIYNNIEYALIMWGI